MRVVILAFALACIAGSASAELLCGARGAVLTARSAGATIRVVCEVEPGPRWASLEGASGPLDESGDWKFHFGMAGNDVDPNVDGVLRTRPTAEETETVSYELTAGQDQPLFDIYHSTAFPLSEYAGGTVVADGTNVLIDVVYANRGRPLSGAFRKLEFRDRKGVLRLTVDYPEPTRLELVDSRAWGASFLDLRVPMVGRRVFKKRETCRLAFRLKAPDGIRENFRRCVVEKGTDWVPMRFDTDILKGSACDFSSQIGLDAPAGKHGWIVAKGEDFVFEDSPDVPRRFYGNNLAWRYPILERPRIAKLAQDLTRTGYNAVRLHFWDIVMTEGVKDGTTIPEERLVAFDGFMKEMIDAGIYLATDLYSARNVPYREIGIDRDGFVPMDEFKELLLCHEPAVSNLERYVRQLLTHRNVHTGRDYAHEPALAWYCLVNEGDAGNFGMQYAKKHPYMREAWTGWLKAKKAEDPDYADVPEELPENCRALTLHAAAYRQFLRFLETRLDRRLTAFVRALGSKALVSSMNAWFNPPGYQLVRNDVYDYVDDHFYVDHPVFSPGRRYPTTCDGRNPVSAGAAGVPHVVSRRLTDRPFTVTEYNYSVPGRFRGTSGLLVGAFAALQNWSGVWRFCFGKEPVLIEDANAGPLRFHDTWCDPIMRASEYPFAALFLRGDLAPLKETVSVALPRKDLEKLHVEPLASIIFPWLKLAWYARTGTHVGESSDDARFDLRYPEAYKLPLAEARSRRFPGFQPDDPLPPTADGAVRFDERKGTFAVDTPRTCGVAVESGALRAGVLEATVEGAPAAVWAVSHDGLPLKDSKRILVGHLTDALQAGTKVVGEDASTLIEWGRTGEMLVRSGQAVVSLGLGPDSFTVWALSSGGRRVARIPTEKTADGRLRFVASVGRDPANATYLYEVVREDPCAAFRSDPFRPQLRYTPKYGWMNDPNGLVYDRGKWHFFCQHNPTGLAWGNSHWNHAVSDDLVLWRELGEALCPDEQGTMFSGSAVVDRGGVAGFGQDVQVLFYTHDVKDGHHFVQCLAWSKDRLHYTKAGGDPVVPFRARKNRDPKVFWHAPTKRWVMALYGTESGRHTMWTYSSENLRDWTPESSYRGGVAAKSDLWLFECPGLEELAIEGETNTAWVVWGAMPEYAVGAFDGRRFAPVEERIPSIAYVPGVPYHGNEAPYYAAQTFNDVPDGRKIWMAWFRLPHREGAMTRHSASVPHELSLRRTSKGLRLVRRPARELKKLRMGPCVPLERYSGELAELHLSCRLAEDGKVAFDLRGVNLSYDAQTQALKMAGTEVPWALNGRKLELIVYLDRVGAEVFSGDGLLMAPIPDAFPDAGKRSCSVAASFGADNLDCRAYELKSIWE